jgi:hypothetical protein
MGKEHLKGQYFPFSPENPGEFGILTAIKLGQISFFYIFSRKIVFFNDIPWDAQFRILIFCFVFSSKLGG